MKIKWIYLILLISPITFSSNVDRALGYDVVYVNKDNLLIPEEVEVIVYGNDEVQAWINDTSGFIYSMEYQKGFWYVRFNDRGKFHQELNSLHVQVDDLTKKILGISYTKGSLDIWSDKLEKSEAYVSNHELFQNFTYIPSSFYSAFTMDNSIYSIDFGASFYPSNQSVDSKFAIRGAMKYNRTQSGTYEFTIMRLTLPFHFFNQTSNEIIELAQEDPDVIDFLQGDNNPYISIVQHRIFNHLNKYESMNQLYLPVGTYYEIMYKSNFLHDRNFLSSDQISVTSPTSNQVRYINLTRSDWDWLNIVIRSENGIVITKYGSTIPHHSYDDVVQLIFENAKILNWLDNTGYILSIGFLEIKYSYSVLKGGEYWKGHLELNNKFDSLYFEINANTNSASLSYEHKTNWPKKSYAELESIALNQSDIDKWKLSVDQYNVNFEYNFLGYWKLYFFDPIISDSWSSIIIWDRDGNTQSIETSYSVQPILVQNEVIDIVLSTDLLEFYEKYPQSIITMYFGKEDTSSELRWHVYIYSPIQVEAFIHFIVDDSTSSVEQKIVNEPLSVPDNPKSKIEDLAKMQNEYLDFIEQNTIYYETTYYVAGNDFWFMYTIGYDDLGFQHNLMFQISDRNDSLVPSILITKDRDLKESNSYALVKSPPVKVQFELMLENSLGFETLGQRRNIPLVDVILKSSDLVSSETSGPTLQPSNTAKAETTQSYDDLKLNGFIVIPALITLLLIVPIYMRSQR